MRRIQLPSLKWVKKELAKEAEEKQEGLETGEERSMSQQNHSHESLQSQQERQSDLAATQGSPLRISIQACNERQDDFKGIRKTPLCRIQERAGSKECCTPKDAHGMACLCSFLRQDTALALTRNSTHPSVFDSIYHHHSYSAPPDYHKSDISLSRYQWDSSPTLPLVRSEDQHRSSKADLRRRAYMQRTREIESPVGVLGLKRPRSSSLSMTGGSSSKAVVREKTLKPETSHEPMDSISSSSSTTCGTGHLIACRLDVCTRKAVGHGLCVKHGGSKRCRIDGCSSRAQSKGLCWKHGGYTFCKVDGCEIRAKARGFCWAHGGGTKCKDESCTKVAVSRGLCWAHGGGKRCKIQGCNRPGYQRNDGFCSLHQTASTE